MESNISVDVRNTGRFHGQHVTMSHGLVASVWSEKEWRSHCSLCNTTTLHTGTPPPPRGITSPLYCITACREPQFWDMLEGICAREPTAVNYHCIQKPSATEIPLHLLLFVSTQHQGLTVRLCCITTQCPGTLSTTPKNSQHWGTTVFPLLYHSMHSEASIIVICITCTLLLTWHSAA